ncbi:MAG: hypothetical protein GQ554_02625 [Deltaproteobacteria bacterium]|nr:hypothetical protein [Deltaproteobacteria bacterium]
MAPAFSFPNPTYCATDLSLKVNPTAINVRSKHHLIHSTLPYQVYSPSVNAGGFFVISFKFFINITEKKSI